MYLQLICLLVLSTICWGDNHGRTSSEVTSTSSLTHTADENRTTSETSQNIDGLDLSSNVTSRGLSWFSSVDSEAAMRTFYVVAFAMSTVVIYFVVRAVRLRRRKSKSRKYGVITSTSALEMEPLEKGEEDDDEDTTLFDVHHHKYGQK